MSYIAFAVVAALLIYGVVILNGLVRERNMVREGWSGIDVQLRRRADLVPALVETVKAYAAHERKLFEEITAIRSASLAAADVRAQESAERALESALGKLIALKEAYPDLKADRNFLKLQEQLAEIEDQLQMARRYYNGSVRNLNISIQSFPNLLIARPLGFKEAEFFEADEAGRVTPNVSFERA
ncbi:LemA family protein [Pseudorhodoplanes sp.]|uniref:LemA family protein n=1 Tax=Pseudorhodoplanes sp. TaxID=1934341 RepID=UPI00391A6BB3